ncbi:MAG: DoxX family protein [Planctomycetes bacterium]|nr:DoxX family protein [Planctomycetota bacterium]
MFRLVNCYVLGALFVLAGANHFYNPDFYLPMMPPYLPLHLELVYISGVFEILGGIGLMVPKTRTFAMWGLLALLVAVFPANVQMYIDADKWSDKLSETGLIIRLLFQPVVMLWVYWAARPIKS